MNLCLALLIHDKLCLHQFINFQEFVQYPNKKIHNIKYICKVEISKKYVKILKFNKLLNEIDVCPFKNK